MPFATAEAMLDGVYSQECTGCDERVFADELQSFLGRCQILAGSISIGSDVEVREVLAHTLAFLPRPRTPAHYAVLRTTVVTFAEICARGSTDHHRLPLDDWSNEKALTDAFRDACEAALIERVWQGGASNPQVHRALSELRRHGTEASFNARSTARACGLSVAYLLRLLRADLGMSFGEVLRRYRVAVARRRLTLSDETIKEVAVNVGYGSSSHFVKDFKKECGVTPGAFRRDRPVTPPQ